MGESCGECGRPLIRSDTEKYSVVGVRMGDRSKMALDLMAKESGLSRSEYIRRVLFAVCEDMTRNRGE